MLTDRQLLTRYLAHGDQQAFGELVNRHIDMVHGVAVRSLANPPPQDAADVVQAVFLLLSQKAHRIPQAASLAGWLFRATRYCCNDVNKSNAARLRREREAVMRRDTASTFADDWQPILDEALEHLGEKERQAILLCYLEGKSIAETSEALAISVEAAKKRLQRGLEKLRAVFARRGFVVPAAMLTTGLLAQGAKAAPLGLAATVAVPASATPAVVGIAQGAALLMKLAIVKWVAAACVVVLAATGVIVPLAATPPVAAPPPAPAPTTIPASVPRKQFTYYAVVRDEAGQPITNAKAWLESIDELDRNNIRIEAQTVSGPDGSITLGPVEGVASPFARRIAVVDVPSKAWAWSTLQGNPYEDRPVEQIVAVAPKSVAGTVLNEDGQPIEGASVSIFVCPAGNFRDFFAFSKVSGRAVITDRLGRFMIPRVLADSRAHVLVEAPGYATYLTGTPHESAYVPAGADDVDIVLKRGVSVTVQLTKDGQPYHKPGVIIKGDDVDDGRDFDYLYVVSNDAGQAVFDGLKPGRYSFRAIEGGALAQDQLVGQSEVMTVQVGETRSIEVACVQGRLLRGQVVRDGNITEQAVLRIWRPMQWSREKHSIAIPPDGRFTAVVSAGEYYLDLQDHSLFVGGKPQRTLQVDGNPPPTTPIDLELRLNKGARSRYRLVDSQGRGIEGVVSDGKVRLETDADGRFLCPRVNEKAMIAWDRPKKLAKIFDPGKLLPESDIRLEPTADIHGRVELPPGCKPQDVKLPLSFQNVDRSGFFYADHYFWQTHIGPSGKFRIAPVPVGLDVAVSNTFRGRTWLIPNDDHMTLKSGESRNVGLLEIVRADPRTGTRDIRVCDSTITGRVVDEHEQPVKGQFIEARIPDGSASTITDHRGRFELKGIPRGDVALRTHTYYAGFSLNNGYYEQEMQSPVT
ncbi:MAG: sigma-70 family RNA polymerase sigma factor, partial [Phycisphaerales bacterium]|nr:sigma-70 family RNA polymerase sigma factor [Phycisphaerales bacterium]